MACSALGAAIALVFPICVRYITKDVLESGMANASGVILRIGLLMLALTAVHTCAAMFSDYKGHDMGAKIERDMRKELFDHMQKLSFSFFDSQKVGQLMSRLTNDLLNLTELYHHGPENLVIHGTEFIGALVILLFINPSLTLIICIFLPLMAFYSSFFFRKLQKVYKKSRESIADVNSQAEENLSGIRIVKSFTNEAAEIERFSVANNNFYQSRKSIYKHEALHYTIMDTFFTRLISISIVVFGGIRITNASLDLADLLIFIMYAGYLTAPIPRLTFMVQQFQDGMAGYNRFREIMDTEPDIKNAPDAIELKAVEGRVEFRNVTFKYNDDQKNILHNINLDVPAGETIAIVGHSGVGKTTLCSLIPRFYEAIAGEIRIDGMNICKATLQSLRRQIGVVQQDNFLFGGTIMENILYGKPVQLPQRQLKPQKKQMRMILSQNFQTDTIRTLGSAV
ncbi:atp-binding cassette sub-family b [Holotrichia oblita]|nr:atp-binding cassette sub-family b [Holotrichia oblita]